MRAFLGVGLDAHAVAFLQQWRAGQPAGLRWVPDANLHMTVLFLGQIDQAQCLLLDNTVQPVVAGQAPIDLQWHAVDGFPSAEHPRVLAWLPSPCKALLVWQQQLLAALQQAGFTPDTQPYRPHISLTRGQHVCALPCRTDNAPQRMRIEHLTLFRSDSTPQGVRYTALMRWPLAASR